MFHPGRIVLLLTAAFAVVCSPVCCPSHAAEQQGAHPDSVCAPCHKEIYDRYRATPMAHASGSAAEGFLPGDFRHAASGVHYRVYEDRGKVWLSYEREDKARLLRGKQQLLYFIGSGKRGRTYLFEQQGYWFEVPINWYAKKQVWDMAPAYQDAREMPLTLPVDPGCLHCHTSGAASSLPAARNLYAGAPFASGGIGCTSCHGDAAAHLASRGKAGMMDIDKLEPIPRVSICLNCHLEGDVGVDRDGKRPEDFRPGDNLFDYSVYFVHRGENGSGGRATSQWEALLRSQCRQKSGERLTCTTCHDPHGGPAPQKRVQFYREKCLQCHGQASFVRRHHPENSDCTQCHMARPPSSDIAHEQVTDHWIRKHVSNTPQPRVTSGDLISVGGVAAGARDLGLAYAQEATGSHSRAGTRAFELLREGEREADGAHHDYELHAELGLLEQVGGQTEAAAREYRMALAADPDDASAAANLGFIQAQAHRPDAAAVLWQEVFAHDPTELGTGFNLAVVQCGAGEPGSALETLDRILEFAPDNDRARTMAREIRSGERACRVR